MSFDIRNAENLRKINDVLQGNPKAAESMQARFPFHQLCEVLPLNIEVISEISNIFASFIKYGNVHENLFTILNFYNQNIEFQINNDDCDFALLSRFLIELLNALRRDSELSLNYVSGSLVKTLHSIAHHPNVPDDVLRLSIITFANYLKRSFEKEAHFGEMCAGMWKAASTLQINARLILVHSFIYNTQPEDFPNVDEVYRYLIQIVKLLPKCEDNLIKEILLCVMESYTKCKTKDILKSISVELATINFPKCIAHYFLLGNNLLQMHEIYFHEISVIFEKTPWNTAVDNLREIVTNLDKPFLLKREPDDTNRTDFDFIVYYLELVYKDLRHHTLPLIKDMVKMYGHQLPGNPAALKSIYLLFAAYVESQTSPQARAFQNDLLLSLQHCEDLENFLTYHVAQILWVLRYGSRILKQRVVTMWIKQKDEEILGLLFRCLKNVEQQKILLDVICYEEDTTIKRDAMDVFILCHPDPREQLTHLLLRQDMTMDTLDCIMKGNPKEIKLCKAEDPQYAIVLAKICALTQRMIGIVTDEKLGLLESTKNSIIVHLHNTCWQLSGTEHADCFVVGKLAKVVAEATKSKSSKDACNAFKFLMLIATTQVHLNIGSSERIELEPIVLHENIKLIKYAVKLYLYVLHASYGDNRLISAEERHLGVYHNVLDILIPEGGHAAFQLVVLLLERYEDCVASAINIFAIRTNCRQVIIDVNFVKYLTIWCQLASKYKYIRIPVRLIAPYVKHLETIQYKDADYAVLKKFAITTDLF